jgi:poly(U)-binding-splicing factor PUF60
VAATEAATGTSPEQRAVILEALNKALSDAQLKLAVEQESLPRPAAASVKPAGLRPDGTYDPDHPAPGVMLPGEMAQQLAAVMERLREQLGFPPPGAAASTAAALAAAAALPGLGGAGVASGAAAATAAATNPARVYVGSMHYELGEREVRAIFSPFGTILKVDMSHEPSTGRTKGYCFLTFDSVDAAQRAIDGMNGQVIAGRAIKVSRPAGGASGVPGATGANMMPVGGGGGVDPMAAAAAAVAALPISGGGGGGAFASSRPPAARVFVGNVPQEFTVEHIRAVFMPFGSVRNVSLLPSTDPTHAGSHRGYGFIEFDDEGCAQSAIQAMNGFEVAGRKLRVNVATSTHMPGGGGGGGGAAAGSVPLPPELAGRGMLGALGYAMPQQQQQVQQLPQQGLNLAALAAQAAAAVTGGGMGAAPPLPQVAPPLPPQQPPLPAAPYGGYGGGAAPVGGGSRSRVLILLNMVGPEEAGDPSLPGEVAEECSKYGPVDGVRVALRPAATPGGPPEVGVFVAFRAPDGALAGVQGLDRRFFGGRVTVARLYPEPSFFGGDFQAAPLPL